MKEKHSNFDLSDGQLEEIQDKYAFLEPLLDGYLSLEKKIMPQRCRACRSPTELGPARRQGIILEAGGAEPPLGYLPAN